MNDTVLTVILTSVLNLLGFIISNRYYTPIAKYKDLKARTSYSLIYYANKYSNPIDIANTNNKMPDDYETTSIELRKLAAEWRAFIQYKNRPAFCIVNDEKIKKVSNNLIALSNSLTLPYSTKNSQEDYPYGHTNSQLSDEIKKLLNL